MNKPLPQVGDIVYWTGFGGPQYVLILKKIDFVITTYKVLLLSGPEFDDDEWTLTDSNSGCWEVVA